MNIYIVGGIAAYACLVMLALALNHGAHRKPTTHLRDVREEMEEA
jgi:hypothetical protein